MMQCAQNLSLTEVSGEPPKGFAWVGSDEVYLAKMWLLD